MEIIVENTVQKADLIIQKRVTTETPDQSFLFTVSGNGRVLPVVIPADAFRNGPEASVTVYDLPVGEYTVTEDTDWCWRYRLDSVQVLLDRSAVKTSDSVMFQLTPEGETVTFTNSRENDLWRDGETYCENRFEGLQTEGGQNR